MKKEPAHSNLGASSAERWVNCPGSVKLSEGIPNKSSSYAKHGTAAHHLCDLKMRKPKLNLYKHLGRLIGIDGSIIDEDDFDPISDNGEFFKIDEVMIESVEDYIETVQSHVERLGREDVQVFSETKFSLADIREGMFGTNDACVIKEGEEIVIIDFKYGAGKYVAVEYNMQLMYYALGALYKFFYKESSKTGHKFWSKKTPPKVTLVIVQPRCISPEGSTREWSTSSEYIIQDYAQILKDALKQVDKKNPPLKDGAHCFFCLAKFICPLKRQKLAESVQTDFANLDVDVDFDLIEEPKHLPSKQQISAIVEDTEYLEKVLRAAPSIREFLSQLEEKALSDAIKGRIPTGFKLVEKSTRRKWTNEQEAYESLSLFFGEEDLLTQPKLKSFTELEKLKGASKLVSSLTSKPKGNFELVFIGSKKKKIVDSIQEDFENI